jgi:TPR repeat protein
MRRILAGLVLILMLTTAAAAGPYEDGVRAYQGGNYATALRLWRPLAEQGNALAQFNLGIMYRRGQGVPQDYAEAVKWNRLAAEQGDAEAQYNLGVSYHRGEGVPQDYVQAHMLFDLAASRLEAEERDMAIKNRDIVASKMTPEQIAEAQKLAREWKPK